MKDPYVYKNSDVLINKANLKEKDKLDEFENRMTNLALVMLFRSTLKLKMLMTSLGYIKYYLKMYTNGPENRGQ